MRLTRATRIRLLVLAGLLAVAAALMPWAWARLGVGSVAEGDSPVTVVAAGDISCEPDSSRYNQGQGTGSYCHAKATSDLALSLRPDEVLALGDEQYRNGNLNDFKVSYEQTWGRLKPITKPVPGNHEYGTLGAAGYYQYFGAAAGVPELGYYSFNLGDWHVVALNSQCTAVSCEQTSAQEQWLRRDLEANQRPCVLAYWHEPRFSSGDLGGNAAYQPFWVDLQEFGADVVLSGHDHDYERFAPQRADGTADAHGPREFVVGTGGDSLTRLSRRTANSQVWDNQDYGVLKLTLAARSYSWQFITDKGVVKDSGSSQCTTVPVRVTPKPTPMATPQPTPSNR